MRDRPLVERVSRAALACAGIRDPKGEEEATILARLASAGDFKALKDLKHFSSR